MRGLESTLEHLVRCLELAKTVILCDTSLKNQAFNPYSSTAPLECILEVLEVVFKLSWSVSKAAWGILEALWSVLDEAWSAQNHWFCIIHVWKIMVPPYILRQHLSNTSCMRLKSSLGCPEAFLSHHEGSWRRLGESWMRPGTCKNNYFVPYMF